MTILEPAHTDRRLLAQAIEGLLQKSKKNVSFRTYKLNELEAGFNRDN